MRIEDIDTLVNSIEITFQEENLELLEKRNKLTSQLGEFREEIDGLNNILGKKRSLVSFSKAVKVLDAKEIEMLVNVSTCRTKRELYRKSFRNADPYDPDSWEIINLLESLNLVKVHRNDVDKSIKYFECLVPNSLIEETFNI